MLDKHFKKAIIWNIFFLFSQETGFDISCQLSGKIKKNIIIFHLLNFPKSGKNEIFKVKLISIKAYSPQDIISLIWAVHREIDLQKKDN